MAKKIQIALIWWPHSGGRWLSRTILKRHSKVHQTAFTHPWLYYSTDMMLELDNTAQVHKARSLPKLKEHLHALVNSIEHGKAEGLKQYFEDIDRYEEADGQDFILGEICMGSPIPRKIDIELLMKANPDMKVIHLVRNPKTSFMSFVKRFEMDNDPVKIAGSWVSLNYSLRDFFDKNDVYTNNYLCVKYEDLLENAEDEVRRICDFTGMEFESAMVESLDERWGRSTRPQIDENSERIIDEIANVELKNYNY